jgi:hypothetical protein
VTLPPSQELFRLKSLDHLTDDPIPALLSCRETTPGFVGLLLSSAGPSPPNSKEPELVSAESEGFVRPEKHQPQTLGEDKD